MRTIKFTFDWMTFLCFFVVLPILYLFGIFIKESCLSGKQTMKVTTMIQRHNKWKHTQSSASTSVSSEQNTDEVDAEEFIHASLAMMDE